MPFITACPYCPAKLKVPDQSLGMSICCPKCSNNFTVAPEELAPSKGTVRFSPPAPRQPPPPAAQPAPPPADMPWWVTPEAGAASPSVSAEPKPPPPPPTAPDKAPSPITPEPFTPELPDLPQVDQPSWLNPWGGTAFFLAGLALLLAAFALPRLLVIPITVLGVLLSLAGFAAAGEDRQVKDTIWLILGGGGSLLVLVLAAFLPSWLNPQYAMDFDVPAPDLNKTLLVSRDNKVVLGPLATDDRVDAEKDAFRQGDVLIRVENVVVDKGDAKSGPALLITLHVANVGQLHDVLYHGQASEEQGAVVRDSRGQELQRRERAGSLRTVSILPSHDVTDVLAFEPPWTGTAHLDLDLPASAWGKEGACRFRIPATFILQLRPKQGR